MRFLWKTAAIVYLTLLSACTASSNNHHQLPDLDVQSNIQAENQAKLEQAVRY